MHLLFGIECMHLHSPIAARGDSQARPSTTGQHPANPQHLHARLAPRSPCRRRRCSRGILLQRCPRPPTCMAWTTRGTRGLWLASRAASCCGGPAAPGALPHPSACFCLARACAALRCSAASSRVDHLITTPGCPFPVAHVISAPFVVRTGGWTAPTRPLVALWPSQSWTRSGEGACRGWRKHGPAEGLL